MFALASTKASKSNSETRHSLPILYPRRWPFRSHCVTVRSFIWRRLATSVGVRSIGWVMTSRISSFAPIASISCNMEFNAVLRGFTGGGGPEGTCWDDPEGLSKELIEAVLNPKG